MVEELAASALQARKWPRLDRAIVGLPPRLLGTIVPEPARCAARRAWNAPVTVARFPILIVLGRG